MTTEIEKMYENAGIKPEYRYDCNLADTIKPEEVFSLRSCSKGEIKDFCTNKEYYKYCKVYKANKLYPPFTAEKQVELISWLARKDLLQINYSSYQCYQFNSFRIGGDYKANISEALASHYNNLWQSLTEEEQEQIRGILK